MNFNTFYLFLKASIRSAHITATLKPPARSSTMPTTTDQQVPYRTDASTIGKNIYSFLQDELSRVIDCNRFISLNYSMIS